MSKNTAITANACKIDVQVYLCMVASNTTFYKKIYTIYDAEYVYERIQALEYIINILNLDKQNHRTL